jgi:disulfide bond formation protein DsbB
MESFVLALTRPRVAAGLLLAASALALATAYVAQYWGGLEPCPLCLYQRVPYAVAGALATAALFVRASHLTALLLLAAVTFFANAGIAFYHVGVENHWWASAVCPGDAPAIASVEDLRKALAAPPPKPCDAVDWTLFGVSMAGYNMIASLGLTALAFAAAARAGESPRASDSAPR